MNLETSLRKYALFQIIWHQMETSTGHISYGPKSVCGRTNSLAFIADNKLQEECFILDRTLWGLRAFSRFLKALA